LSRVDTPCEVESLDLAGGPGNYRSSQIHRASFGVILRLAHEFDTAGQPIVQLRKLLFNVLSDVHVRRAVPNGWVHKTVAAPSQNPNDGKRTEKTHARIFEPKQIVG